VVEQQQRLVEASLTVSAPSAKEMRLTSLHDVLTSNSLLEYLAQPNRVVEHALMPRIRFAGFGQGDADVAFLH
jgi:hypothetical protein